MTYGDEYNNPVKDSIGLTIVAGADGGLIIYESIEGVPQQTAMFGGDLEQTTQYLNKRMDKLQKEVAEAQKPKVEPIPHATQVLSRISQIEERKPIMDHIRKMTPRPDLEESNG